MGRKQPYKFTDMFYGFNHHPDKYILAYLLFMVVVLVPMLPAIAVSVGMYVIAISGSMAVTKGFFIGYVAVSYTHLDVYKRQGIHYLKILARE